MITLLFSLAGFFWAKTLYSYYVKNDKKTALPSFALASSLTALAYIASKIKDKEKTQQYEGVGPYDGIIIDPALVKKTCHCEPVCRMMCFARGAIGALSKEQVKKYCKEQLKQLETSENEKLTIQMPSLEQSRSNK